MRLFLIAMLLLSLPALAEPVTNDLLALNKLNVEIAAAEDRGDREWLEGILAPELAFRRANGVVVGKEQFLRDLKTRDASKTEIESIEIYGKNRGIVTCIVTIKIDGKDVAFHNVRIFIRDGEGWKLLGWANERWDQPGPRLYGPQRTTKIKSYSIVVTEVSRLRSCDSDSSK